MQHCATLIGLPVTETLVDVYYVAVANNVTPTALVKHKDVYNVCGIL